MTRRRAILLPVVLVIVGLLALTMAGFIFFIQSETAGATALSDMQHARLAAEGGLEELTAVLRAERHNSVAWFDDPQRWRHALVWARDYDRQGDPIRKGTLRKDLLDKPDKLSPAWRYSVVAPALDGPDGAVRYGLTPESAKLNLNTASEAQIRQLLTPLLTDLGLQNAPDLIAALLDWREPGTAPRPGGAKDEYYNTLKPPYRCKQGPFDTVEELLLVKGFSAAILYGEDTNRNGVLDQNEDDGDASAPFYDNADGKLNLGIAPFLTVLSREPDTALDNKPRISLHADAATLTAQIEQYVQEGELSPQTIAFIQELKQGGFDFGQLRSPADLLPPEPSEIAAAESTGDTSGSPEGAAGATLPPTGGSRGSRGSGRQSGASSQPSSSQPAASQPDSGGSYDGLSLPREAIEKLKNSPVTAADLPCLMDRFTTRPPQDGGSAMMSGLVNINAAPYRVLLLVPHMTPEAAAAIVATRGKASAQDLRTTAWPLTAGVVDPITYKAVAPYVTTKAYQVHVEVIGYADHSNVFRRCEWLVEMIGSLAQVRYFRDLTPLGRAWPVDDDTVQTSTR